MKLLWSMCCAFLAVAQMAAAQDLSGYDKLLIPAHAFQPVNGVFSTELTGYTEVDTSYYAGVVSNGGGPVFVIQRAFEPFFPALNYGPALPTGRFLYVERARVADVSLQYTLTTVVSSGATEATALPIVRTPLTGISRILAIPQVPLTTFDGNNGTLVGFAIRNKLRVYDFDGDGSGAVDVSAYIQAPLGPFPFNPRRLRLDRRGGDDPTFPWYGEMDLDVCVPSQSHFTPCQLGPMRVTLAPVGSTRYWGFVSSTDNQTQHVTIYAPQP